MFPGLWMAANKKGKYYSLKKLMSLMWQKYHISLHMRLRRQLRKFSFSSLNFQLEGLIYIETVAAASKGQTKGSNQNPSHLHWWTEESSFLSRHSVLWALSCLFHPPHHRGRCSLRIMHLPLPPSSLLSPTHTYFLEPLYPVADFSFLGPKAIKAPPKSPKTCKERRSWM